MKSKTRARGSVQPRPAQWAGLNDLAKRLRKARASGAGRAIVEVKPIELQTLGRQLEDIAYGKSAAEVFGQDLQTWRKNKAAGHDTNNARYLIQQCTVKYWRLRVEGRTQAAAIKAAIQNTFHGTSKAPAPKTVLKLANIHADEILDAIAGKSVVRNSDGTIAVQYRSGVDVSKVRSSIEKKSRRGKPE